MADETANLVLEQLRRIRASQERMELDFSEMKTRLSSLERHVGEVQISVAVLNSRLDRLDERVGRIERRLELVEV